MVAMTGELRKTDIDMMNSYAGDEPIEVQCDGATLDVFGSELACRRVSWHYRYTSPDKWRVAYSTNLKTWYFTLQVG